MRQYNRYCRLAGMCGQKPVTGIGVLGYRTIRQYDTGRFFQEPTQQIVFTNENGISQPVYASEQTISKLANTAVNPLDVFTEFRPDPCVEVVRTSRTTAVARWLLGIQTAKNYESCPLEDHRILDGDTFTPLFSPDDLNLGIERLRALYYYPVITESIDSAIR